MKRFTPGAWTHRNFRDVYLYIVTIENESPDAVIARALWVRKDFGCGELILRDTMPPDAVVIRRDQWPNWSQLPT